jgi:hypothetical protein
MLTPINGGGGNPTAILGRQNADGSWSAGYTFGSSPPPSSTSSLANSRRDVMRGCGTYAAPRPRSSSQSQTFHWSKLRGSPFGLNATARRSSRTDTRPGLLRFDQPDSD